MRRARCRCRRSDPSPRGRSAAARRGHRRDVRVSSSRTSAAPVGLRASLPLKITSSIRSPRRLFALCSPSTHVMASATLLLPHPFGPTMAVTPSSKASSDRSENDLKPAISRRCRRMMVLPRVRDWLRSIASRHAPVPADLRRRPAHVYRSSGWDSLGIPAQLGLDDDDDRDLAALFASREGMRPRGRSDGGECSKAHG